MPKGPNKHDREARAREAVRQVMRNAPQLLEKDMSRKFFRARMETEDVDTLVALAREGDKDALEILRKHARGAAGAGMKVPGPCTSLSGNVSSTGRHEQKAAPQL